LSVKFLDNQNQVFGRFGELVHLYEEGETSYEAYKVLFKFPSEHSLDGNYFEGEL